MAYAETGDFAAAVKYQEQALCCARSVPRRLTTRLELFRQNKPYRLPGRYEAIAGWGRSAIRWGTAKWQPTAGPADQDSRQRAQSQPRFEGDRRTARAASPSKGAYG